MAAHTAAQVFRPDGRPGPDLSRETARRPPAARLFAVERRLAAALHRSALDRSIRLELWDGRSVGPPADAADAVVRLTDRAALFGLIVSPEMAFGDGYASGRIEVSGDMLALLRAAYRRAGRPSRASAVMARAGSLANTRARARANIHHHYDLGSGFYRLWLDDQLVYTCAYFRTPDASLEDAQVAKLEHVCRKLRLQPGEHVIEAGCGWGALALHMASRFGVTVTAYNISAPQIAAARARAHASGLDGQVEFVLGDSRNIEGRCDAFVSVGMLEHLGVHQYAALGRAMDRTLDATRGRGLLHFIGRDAPAPLSGWIERRIFPGAYPPTLPEAIGGVLEPFGFSVVDVENLRPHYAKTLEHWLTRFDRAASVVSARFGDRFTRAWRLYLAGSLIAFETGSLQLFQVAFARGAADAVPWTRDALYCEGPTTGPP